MDENKTKNELYHANAFSLYCFWLSAFIISFVWVLDRLNIFLVDQRLVSVTLAGCIIVLILVNIVKYTLGFEKKSTSYIMLFLLTALFSFGHATLSYHVLLFMVFPMLCSVLYHEKSYTYYTFVLSALGMVISDLVGFTFGLCDANLVLITTSTTNALLQQLSKGENVTLSTPGQIVLLFSFPRIMALFAFMLLLNHIRHSIREKTVQEIESRRKAEIDALTGLYNRNKFNEDIENPGTGQVSVIFADLNDLKKTNDTLGHEQGDVLIKGIADILKLHLSERVRTYRIGGDEFVVLIARPAEGEAERLVEIIREEAENQKLEYDLKLSVAIGYSNGNGRDIREVIHEADERMYENKLAQKKQRKAFEAE